MTGATRSHALGLTAARAGYGLALLAGPWPTDGPAAGRRIAEILGLRHLAQAGLSAAVPTTPVLVFGARIDLLHALTMAGYAAVHRPVRRAAIGQAAIAVGFAIAGTACARRAPRALSSQTLSTIGENT